MLLSKSKWNICELAKGKLKGNIAKKRQAVWQKKIFEFSLFHVILRLFSFLQLKTWLKTRLQHRTAELIVALVDRQASSTG